MSPDDPVQRLLALERFGIKLGLDNIRCLTAALADPQEQFATIHIAGTNGKGSVAAMVERGLRHAGCRTGRYTSPHLSHIEERIGIDGVAIDAAIFRAIAADVLDVVERLRAAGSLETTPTFFEVTTAMAFEAFRRGGVQVAVIEVGLGGRFDATNVIIPEVAAITSIALDHQKYLGDSLASIAFEKAGILKAGVPCVVGQVPPAARSVIEKVAKEVGTRLSYADAGLVEAVSLERGRATISVRTARSHYRGVHLALPGRHQVANALVAIRVLEEFAHRRRQVSDDSVVAALTEVNWPARLEWLRVREDALVLLDAAHNVAGAESLASYLRDSGVAPLPIVLAVMKDKDVSGIIAALESVATRFVATTADTPRALPAAELARRVASVAASKRVDSEDDPRRAVDIGVADGGRAAAAGSIFFVGPLRESLLAAGAISLQSS